MKHLGWASLLALMAMTGLAAAEPAPGAAPAVSVINKAGPAPDAAAADVGKSDAAAAPAAEVAAPPTTPTGSPAPAATAPPSADAEPASAGTTPGSAPAPAAEAAPATAEAAAPAPPPEPSLAISINLSSQRMTVTENGTPKYTWAISSGRRGYVTPTGTFKPVWMSKMWYSRKYDYAPMPHAIFFHGGTAIHGTSATGMLGRPASHGCVRLAPGNAATLFRLVNKHGKAMTEISVHGTPKHRNEPQVAARGTRRYAYPPGYRYQPRGYYSYSYSGGYYSAPGAYAPSRKYYKPRRYVQRGYYGGGYAYGY